jgi:hypothetical protein
VRSCYGISGGINFNKTSLSPVGRQVKGIQWKTLYEWNSFIGFRVNKKKEVMDNARGVGVK